MVPTSRSPTKVVTLRTAPVTDPDMPYHRWMGLTVHGRKRLRAGLEPLPSSIGTASTSNPTLQDKFAPLICSRCVLSIESGLPAEVDWGLRTLGQLSSRIEILLRGAPGVIEALLGLIVDAWDCKSAAKRRRLQNAQNDEDPVNAAIRSCVCYAEGLDDGLLVPIDSNKMSERSCQALLVLRNLSCTEANTLALCRVLCCGHNPILERLLKSKNLTVFSDALDILCNIATAIPKDATWPAEVLTEALLENKNIPLIVGALAQLFQVLKFSAVRQGFCEELPAEFFATIAAVLCREGSTRSPEGQRSAQIAALEILFNLSELTEKVRSKILGAPLGITQLVTMVAKEDPRQKIPQRAAQTLANLCQGKLAAEILHRHMDQLLETSASTAHAELSILVVQVVDQIYTQMRSTITV